MRKQTGFTLMEALIALGMGTVFLVSAISTWTYTTKTWKEENVRTELRFNVEKSLEKLKEDIRLSDGGKITFYPVGSTTYSAIAMPREYVNANGLYDISSGITWSDTVIYHLNSNTLSRTEVPYSASSAVRQTQVDEAATTGSVSGGTTTTLFTADAISMGFTPTSPQFDGYAASVDRSANTSFGNVLLTPGNHTVRFEVTGKNASSSGYRLGLDSVALTPSGSEREAEALSILSDSGRNKVTEDMTPYPSAGLWGGNYQLEYQASGIGDFIQFQLYNDEWLESNFANMTHTYTEVTGTDPVLAVASRENQGSPNWRADIQTAAVDADNLSNVNNRTIRCIVNGSQFARPSTMVRFKFRAATAGALRINAAYVGLRLVGTENFLAAPSQLYFGNSPVAPGGTDGTGATGTTGTVDIQIPADNYVWSNWVVFPVAVPSTDDYLVSFSVSNGVGNGNETYWEPGGAVVQAYMVDGDRPTEVWTLLDAGYTTSTALHATAEMQSWYHVGTGTSQVYDTRMSNPAYSQISWDTNGVGSYVLKVRSSNDAQMVGASAWSALGGYASSPSAISGAGSGRYVQFQVEMTGASPYTSYPAIDDVSIRWPGQTTLVELSGYFTKRPTYGLFKVMVDGNDVVSALQMDLSATKTYQGKDQTITVSTETKPKNTGK